MKIFTVLFRIVLVILGCIIGFIVGGRIGVSMRYTGGSSIISFFMAIVGIPLGGLIGLLVGIFIFKNNKPQQTLK